MERAVVFFFTGASRAPAVERDLLVVEPFADALSVVALVLRAPGEVFFAAVFGTALLLEAAVFGTALLLADAVFGTALLLAVDLRTTFSAVRFLAALPFAEDFLAEELDVLDSRLVGFLAAVMGAGR
ncbi:hypothetical protein BH24ACT26_BH24ACT26_05700 [soil metagenome]